MLYIPQIHNSRINLIIQQFVPNSISATPSNHHVTLHHLWANRKSKEIKSHLNYFFSFLFIYLFFIRFLFLFPTERARSLVSCVHYTVWLTRHAREIKKRNLKICSVLFSFLSLDIFRSIPDQTVVDILFTLFALLTFAIFFPLLLSFSRSLSFSFSQDQCKQI